MPPNALDIIELPDGFKVQVKRWSPDIIGADGKKRLTSYWENAFFRRSDGWTRPLLEEALHKLRSTS